MGGLDSSSTLVGYARSVMPEGNFVVREAADLDPSVAADVVLSSGVFHYFPSLEYAYSVLERMARKAHRALAVLDVPDKVKEEESLAARRESLGPWRTSIAMQGCRTSTSSEVGSRTSSVRSDFLAS